MKIPSFWGLIRVGTIRTVRTYKGVCQFLPFQHYPAEYSTVYTVYTIHYSIYSKIFLDLYSVYDIQYIQCMQYMMIYWLVYQSIGLLVFYIYYESNFFADFETNRE